MYGLYTGKECFGIEVEMAASGEMTPDEIVQLASSRLQQLSGEVLDVMEVFRPSSVAELLNLSRLVSKLSPIVGNIIEFRVVEFLNRQPEFESLGSWVRQDPGFPDAVFVGFSTAEVSLKPGFEVKAWFPFATEITGRFKTTDVQLSDDHISVCILAWVPEYLVFGKPRLVDLCLVSGLSVAHVRNAHYYNPPHYVVSEPEDTSSRTANLQQSNTEGYILQETESHMRESAAQMVEDLGLSTGYSSEPDFQSRIGQLRGSFAYRLDTNYGKIDRIAHEGIEDFKQRVLETEYLGRSLADWKRLFGARTDAGPQNLLDALYNGLGDQLGGLADSASKRLIP